ncbi:MAG: N-acetylglucosamine-6-phosphate deacetylase [Micromonosporaceae bacterium]
MGDRRTVLRNARIVTPDGVIHGGLEVSGVRIAAIRAGAAAGAEAGTAGTDPTAGAEAGTAGIDPGGGASDDLAAGWVLPGFVDIHVHGGGGSTYTTGDPDQARQTAAFHLRHGTTTSLASLVSSGPELLLDATVALAPLVADGVVAGIHHEGPYLARTRCGAQNPATLRDPDLAELSRLLEAADGGLRMVTIAPELPGALHAISWLSERGVTVAVGHTDATYAQTMDGIRAGATVGTHLFNGMRPPHHREPGPVYALLGARQAVCELIADGTHLHDATLRFAADVAGPARAALVTDAMAAAGMPDGQYELGGQPVTVADGVARLGSSEQEPGSIAGSSLTMDAALRRAVAAGISLVDAATMAATTPARTVGLDDRGALVAGKRADLVVFDDDLRVRRVMRAGQWVA